MQRTDFIAVNEPLLDGNEKKYLTECIDTGWISSEGPFVEKFELAFSSRVGRKWGIAVCNGTAALDAAIEALGIGPGDEVILPAFTIISCIGQLIRCGATTGARRQRRPYLEHGRAADRGEDHAPYESHHGGAHVRPARGHGSRSR